MMVFRPEATIIIIRTCTKNPFHLKLTPYHKQWLYWKEWFWVYLSHFDTIDTRITNESDITKQA